MIALEGSTSKYSGHVPNSLDFLNSTLHTIYHLPVLRFTHVSGLYHFLGKKNFIDV